MVSAGENDVCKDATEEEGDCLLLSFDRNLRRMRWGIMWGSEGHETASFDRVKVFW